MRRALALAACLLCTLGLATPAGAGTGEPGPLQPAQRRANAAAARLAAAQTALAKVEVEVRDLKGRTETNRRRLAGLEGQVRDVAVRQYVQGATRVDWLDTADFSQMARHQAMVRFVTIGSVDAIDEFRAARADLAEGQADLTRSMQDRRAVVGRLRAERAMAERELERLAAAQRALEAKQRAAAQARSRSRGRSSAPRASRTTPTPGGARVIGSGSWICPVQGPRSFSNDWGQPRSGGRSHQGTDILAPRGTPVVANVAGVVRAHQSSLGGKSYYLAGSDGNTYYGAHLDSYGASGSVAAGTVIGTVGNSGNARGGPNHLHFEIHPGGGRAVNPYPTLAAHC